MDWKHGSILQALVIGILCSCVRVVHAKDTLLSSQSMRDGDQFLISANQTFQFGFFSPEGSSLRYVGIWYHKLPGRTIVWVANRDRPVFDTTGVLTFDHYGNMFILDERGCSAVLTYGFGATNATAVTLLDTGNLVLRDTNNWSRILWQSFDYPTDTLLPGMKLGLTGRQNRILISWKCSSDPAPGVFSLGSNPKAAKQLFIWRIFTVYWDSGLWDGQKFPLLPPISSNVLLDYSDDYFSYSVLNGSYPIMLRYVMSVSGKLQQFIWVESEKEWVLIWSQPKPQCDVYNLCGDNGLCNEELTKYCQCLPGFEPGSMAEWQNDVTKGGCIRKIGLNCGSNGTDQDRFRLIPRIKFPVAVDAKFLNASSRGECESSCLRSCSCTAYTFIAGTCQLWYGNLKNTRVIENDTDGTGGDLYLRLSASEFGLDSSPGFSTWMILVIVAASSVLGSLVLVSCICYCLRRRKERVRTRQEKSILTWGAEIASKLREQGATGPDFTLFGFSCIKDATDNFSDEYKLGEGGFGPVYKGKLPEGREVAVKRLSTRSGQGLEEFKNEIVLIAKLQHRNLVRLLGCCIQGEEKILVYEYMLNKSLDFFLFEPTRGAQLDWSRRFHIVKGIAQGLLYLHKHSRLRIIHRDLKASNILLDDEMSPKISDFGLARIFGSDETQANTNRVVGTYGYMSPEYASEGVFSVKSDVFSFGVILLEIVTGRRNAGFYQNGNSSNLLGYAWDLWSDGSWLELVDPVINDDTLHALELHRCIHVALLCVQDSACHRPTMSEVIALLGNENDSVSLTAPKKPVFFSVSIATQTGDVKSSPSFSNAKQTCSLNHLSLTTMHAR